MASEPNAATLAPRIAARLGGRVMSPEETAQCGERFPACGWRPAADKSMNVRVYVDTETPLLATARVQMWGHLHGRRPEDKPIPFFGMWRVELEQRGSAWVVTQVKQLVTS